MAKFSEDTVTFARAGLLVGLSMLTGGTGLLLAGIGGLLVGLPIPWICAAAYVLETNRAEQEKPPAPPAQQ